MEKYVPDIYQKSIYTINYKIKSPSNQLKIVRKKWTSVRKNTLFYFQRSKSIDYYSRSLYNVDGNIASQ